MNTSVRARHDARGFSFVELLVTIIIAGIAFAALVPVFVQASQAGQRDKARNLAKSIAQERIEKIRQLPYNLITQNNLESGSDRLASPPSTIPNYPAWDWASSFGPSAVTNNEGGTTNTKTYDVTYSVVFVGGTNDGTARTETSTGDGTEDYLNVTVGVTWQGNPKPAKTVQLQTLIFRQNDGPQITGLDVSSGSGIDLKGWLTHSTTVDPITFRAVIGPADSGLVKLVKFRVDGPGGPFLLPDGVRDDPVLLDVAYNTTWIWPTVAPLLADGTYTVSATAYSSATGYKVYAGNTWSRMLSVEQGPPAAPTYVYARPGDQEIMLSWTPSTSQDVASYDIYRSTSDIEASAVRIGSFSGQVGSQMPPVFVDWGTAVPPKAPPDGNLTGSAPYYYWIVARDQLGNPADPTSGLPSTSASKSVSATLVSVSVTTPPAISSGTLSASPANQTIVVTWSGEAVDPKTTKTVGGDSLTPNPNGALGGYLVFRDANVTEPYAMILLKATKWSNLGLGWDESHTYSLRAFDGSLNMSPSYGPTLPVTTPFAPSYKLNLTTNGPCTVTVTNRSSQDIVTNPIATPMTGGVPLILTVTPGDYDIKAVPAVSGSTTKYQTVTIIASDLFAATGF